MNNRQETTPLKRALVTGASGALGTAIARRLAADGLHVIMHANQNLDVARTVVHEIERAGGHAECIAFDVTHHDAVATHIEALLESGPIQVIVNNAGMHDDAVMPGMSWPQWQRVIDVSLHGFFNVTQPLLMPMIRTRWGRVINIASIAGQTGNRGQTNYAAAKAGLIGASRSLALEVASRGITVNVVSPGIIESDMSAGAFPTERIKELVPMKRAGRPDEVAALVAFLASDESAYISGQVIGINGALA